MPPRLFNFWAPVDTAEIAQFRQPTEERVSALAVHLQDRCRRCTCSAFFLCLTASACRFTHFGKGRSRSICLQRWPCTICLVACFRGGYATARIMSSARCGSVRGQVPVCSLWLLASDGPRVRSCRNHSWRDAVYCLQLSLREPLRGSCGPCVPAGVCADGDIAVWRNW